MLYDGHTNGMLLRRTASLLARAEDRADIAAAAPAAALPTVAHSAAFTRRPFGATTPFPSEAVSLGKRAHRTDALVGTSAEVCSGSRGTGTGRPRAASRLEDRSMTPTGSVACRARERYRSRRCSRLLFVQLDSEEPIERRAQTAPFVETQQRSFPRNSGFKSPRPRRRRSM